MFYLFILKLAKLFQEKSNFYIASHETNWILQKNLHLILNCCRIFILSLFSSIFEIRVHTYMVSGILCIQFIALIIITNNFIKKNKNNIFIIIL